MYGNKGQISISPFGKVSAIAGLHFPEIKRLLNELNVTSLAYEQWMNTKATERIETKKVSIDGLAEVYKPYIQKLDEVIKALETLARRE